MLIDGIGNGQPRLCTCSAIRRWDAKSAAFICSPVNSPRAQSTESFLAYSDTGTPSMALTAFAVLTAAIRLLICCVVIDCFTRYAPPQRKSSQYAIPCYNCVQTFAYITPVPLCYHESTWITSIRGREDSVENIFRPPVLIDLCKHSVNPKTFPAQS